jgi:hypothetical protein
MRISRTIWRFWTFFDFGKGVFLGSSKEYISPQGGMERYLRDFKLGV